jgi:hypothetical protein
LSGLVSYVWLDGAVVDEGNVGHGVTSTAQHDVFSAAQVNMTKVACLEMLLRFEDLVEDTKEEEGREAVGVVVV